MVSSSDNAVDNVKPNGNTNDNYKNNSSTGLLYGKYLNYCSLPHHEMIRLANGTDSDRDVSVESVQIRSNNDIKKQKGSTKSSRIVLSKEVTKIEEMTFLEEFVAIIVLALGPPNVIFIVPVLTWFFHLCNLRALLRSISRYRFQAKYIHDQQLPVFLK